ncbi:Yip1 family protein [Caldovatus aquaticus]|uniref:YIP1 family protein n=1 Tax=Caldovatus aquaticus TaxID=2865671 RepID=A0ABS7F4N7_9PROT|nr:Yip1 family protein [Caldovatus aquaticus]MBW8270488.1 YIP1 family protein [Caldovatus aquaticus]
MDIVARAQGMIRNPRGEWARIAGEAADTRALLLGYAAPLAAIPAVAGFLATLLLFGGRGVASALVSSIVGYVLGLVGLYIVAKIVEVLAPKFGGVADEPTAMKLVAYAATASWVFGAAVIIPLIGWIVALIGALYSLYTFYLGAPPVVRVPENQAVVFTIAVLVVAIVVNLLIGLVVQLFL